MNMLIEKGIINESVCGSNFTYILSDNRDFLPTEYKVLQNQGNVSFVKCIKILMNGKVSLYYLTNNLKPFSSLIPYLEPDNFLSIFSNLISNIINAKSIGFLSCCNIDTSFDKIYVDTNTHKVSLVYMPINSHIANDYSAFENELRTSFIKLINSINNISDSKTMQLASDLSNGTMNLEDIYKKLKGGIINHSVKDRKNEEPANANLHIIALNAPQYIEIVANKDEFVIGKKASVVDGCVTFNSMISRVHCKINKIGNSYTITDLKSANGTFVNKVRLEPNHPYPIKDSDIIRLANSDFQIKIY